MVIFKRGGIPTNEISEENFHLVFSSTLTRLKKNRRRSDSNSGRSRRTSSICPRRLFIAFKRKKRMNEEEKENLAKQNFIAHGCQARA